MSYHFVCAKWDKFNQIALTNSRTKHRWISMCRENFRRTGLSLIAMHARLSSKTSVAAVCMYPKSRSVSRRYTRSTASLLLERPGLLRRIRLRKWKEKHHLVGNFPRKSDHCSSSKRSLCETDGYQPNRHQPNPTIR